MKKKAYIIMGVMSLIVGVATALCVQFFSGQSTQAHAESNSPNNVIKTQATTISKALDSVPFKIKLPKNIPFKHDDSMTHAIVEQISKDHKSIEVTYANPKTKDFLTLRVTDANAVPTMKNVKDLVLPNGKKVQFYDNGRYQFLYWKQDGYSYSVYFNPGTQHPGKYTSAELMKYVNMNWVK